MQWKINASRLIHVKTTHWAGQDWPSKQPKNKLDSILAFFPSTFVLTCRVQHKMPARTKA